MKIHLDSDIFEIVKNGTKKVECRLNDEKRRQLKIGDKLIFLKRPDDIESIEAIIVDLKYYDNFNDMMNDYSIDEVYLKEYTKEKFLKLLERFYTEDDQKQYGVVAIEFKKVD